MISESQQEQGTLYALRAAGRGRSGGLRTGTGHGPVVAHAGARNCAKRPLPWRKSRMSLTSPPPPELRDRVLQQLASEATPMSAARAAANGAPVEPGKIVYPRFSWVPWAIAALLLGCTVLLAWERAGMKREAEGARQLVELPAPRPEDALSKVAFCELEPTPDAPVRPRAAILWDATQHRGKLRISELAAPAAGKDYSCGRWKPGEKVR